MEFDTHVPDLREEKFIAFDFKSRLSISERVIARARAEARKAWLLARLHAPEERLKAIIKALQHVLQYLTMNRFQILAHGFDLRQLDSLRMIVDRDASNAVG